MKDHIQYDDDAMSEHDSLIDPWDEQPGTAREQELEDRWVRYEEWHRRDQDVRSAQNDLNAIHD